MKRMANRSTLVLFSALWLLAGGAAAQPWQALPDAAPAPADNPTTPEKAELGRLLFFDARASAGETACVDCHVPAEGGDGDRAVPEGQDRNAPTVWNAGFHSVLFWDGRAPGLEAQLAGASDAAHRVTARNLRAVAGYAPYFKAAFGADAVTDENVARAIAAFERTLITPGSPYDRFVNGDASALDDRQQAGMETFRQLGCPGCHMGAAFNGPPMPAGRGFYVKFPTFADSPYVAEYGLAEDPGRYRVTGEERDRHMWRVPTLRNVALTAPYFHNGSVETLDQAVRVMASVQLNRELSDQQVAELVAFLESLSGELPQGPEPTLP